MVEKKVMLEASLMALGFAIQDAIKEGWEIDPDMPLTQVWTQYECGFVREVVQSIVQSSVPVNDNSSIPSSLLKISEPEKSPEPEPVVEVKPEPKKAGRPPKQK